MTQMIERICRRLGYVPETESDERVRLAEIAVIREQNLRAAVEDELAELREELATAREELAAARKVKPTLPGLSGEERLDVLNRRLQRMVMPV